MPEPSITIESRRIAMLIDGDNARSSLIGEMIAEASKYGLVTIRRIYGDWTTTNMKSWKDILNNHAVQPIQQFRYTTGKNATDSSMIIDAMDILYEGVVNGFCLISSDSDFTRLATRIREKGFFVMGVGQKSTPRAFVNACEIFVYTENLENLITEAGETKTTKLTPKTGVAEQIPSDPLPLLKAAYGVAPQDDDGWAFLGAVGDRLRRLDPGFDPRNYGKKQLSHLIRSHADTFEIKETRSKGGPSPIYIRLRSEHT